MRQMRHGASARPTRQLESGSHRKKKGEIRRSRLCKCVRVVRLFDQSNGEGIPEGYAVIGFDTYNYA